MIEIKIFLEFLKIGAFSFGGGMATLPYIYEMSEKTSWIDQKTITNLLSISQITPGPLACNIGTITGFNADGLVGAIIANVAYVIPAMVFMGIWCKLYKKIQNNEKVITVIKIVRSATLALIITSSISIFQNAYFKEQSNIGLLNFWLTINFKSVILGISVYFFQKKVKINSLYVMLIAVFIAGIIKI